MPVELLSNTFAPPVKLADPMFARLMLVAEGEMENPLLTKLFSVKLKGVTRLVSEVTVIVKESPVNACDPRVPEPVPENV